MNNIEIEKLIGKKFGKLTIIDYIGKVQFNKSRGFKNLMLCNCACGMKGMKITYEAMQKNKNITCGCGSKFKYGISKIKGKKFGRLIVLGLSNKIDKVGNKHIMCLCECGNIIEVNKHNVISGHTSSCGCYAKERKSKVHTTHGDSAKKCRLYGIWKGMRLRCNNGKYNNKKYIGMAISKKWDCYTKFKKDMGDEYQKHCITHGEDNTSIDRIDNSKGYYKENCRRSNRIKQANNKDNNVYYNYKGNKKTIAEIARFVGLKYHTLYYRLKYSKMSFKEAVNI